MESTSYWQLLVAVFWSVFVAELGDKTQVATLLFASDQPGARWVVFAGAASALVLSTLIGVLAGGWLGQHVPARMVKLVAALAFIVIGLVTLRGALATA
ncbi:MAG TPA: TMEM165/GDT1 family protein [Candidatus Binatia bacterium]|nr:TMEM165/GDT1 family protein [Candidatus Binatia bacterium]